MKKLIDSAIKIAFEEFKIHPYDFMDPERHAQFKLYSILLNLFYGYITVNIKDSPFTGTHAKRVRLEDVMLIPDSNKRRIPDIVIYKENSEVNYEENSKTFEINNIEAFIEVKYGWGYTTKHLTTDSIIKDFEFIGQYKEIGYLTFFMGNKYDLLDETQKEFYLNTVKDYKSKYKFYSDHVYFIFLDKIITGKDFD